MIKMLEPMLYIKCRQEDLALVKGIMNECTDKFTKFMFEETGREYLVEVQIMDKDFLTAEDEGDCGGVVLFSSNFKIKCINTLNSRLLLCFEEILPDIRKNLFPRRDI